MEKAIGHRKAENSHSTKEYEEEFVEINGADHYLLHYPAQSDTVALFLHGGPGQSEALFAHELSQHWGYCSMVYYDQRGAGKTQLRNKTRAEDISIDVLLDDLRGIIAHVKEKYATDRIVLVGHSWGSVLGTQYVLRASEDIAVYVGFGQVVDMLRGEQIGLEKVREAVEERGSKRDERQVETLGNMEALASVPFDEAKRGVMRLRRLQTKYGFMANYAGMVKTALKSPVFGLRDLGPLSRGLGTNMNLMKYLFCYSVWEEREYRCPMYFLLGKDDWQVPSVLAAEYLERINAPQKGVYWIESAGHLTDIDNPEEFNRALAEIIAGL